MFKIQTLNNISRNGLDRLPANLYSVANEIGAQLKSTSGPAIEKTGDIAALLTTLQEGDVLFIDEIHRLMPVIEEKLYPAMEDFSFDFVIGQGPGARSIKLDVPKFTLVGATTRAGLISAPLRGRFGINFHLDFYPLALSKYPEC